MMMEHKSTLYIVRKSIERGKRNINQKKKKTEQLNDPKNKHKNNNH